MREQRQPGPRMRVEFPRVKWEGRVFCKLAGGGVRVLRYRYYKKFQLPRVGLKLIG